MRRYPLGRSVAAAAAAAAAGFEIERSIFFLDLHPAAAADLRSQGSQY